MGIYEHYRMWRLAEEYESSANRHFMLMALCIVIMGICLLVGCSWPTMVVITMCSFIGAFSFGGFIWHWIEGESNKMMAQDIRRWW